LASVVIYILDEWYQSVKSTELIHREQANMIESYYNNFPERTKGMVEINTKLILKDKSIIKAFKERNREELYEKIKPYHDYFSSVFSKSETVLNFFLTDGTKFLEAQHPESYGENCIYKRPMLSQVIRKPEPVTGLELCVHGVFFRNMEPVYSDGEIIGYVDVGVDISFFTKRIKNIAKVKTIILVDEMFIDAYSPDFPKHDGYYEYYNNSGIPFSDLQKKITYLKKYPSIEHDGKSYEVIKEFKLVDFLGRNIGNYTFIVKRSFLHEWFKKQVVYSLIFAAVGILILIVVIRKGFILSINELEKEHKKTLDDLVALNAGLEEKIASELKKSREKDQIIHEQKRISDMGLMLSSIAHHWRQPINAVGLYIQDVSDSYKTGELSSEYIDRFESDSMRLLKELSASIDRYRTFFEPAGEDVEFRVSDTVKELGEVMSSALSAEGVDLLISCKCSEKSFARQTAADLPECCYVYTVVKGPLNEFKQALLNIIFNSLDAIKERSAKDKSFRGRIHIDMEVLGSNVVLKIIDNGIGIGDNIINDIFNPFFTTKDEGKGAGIGLFMAKTLIERHMGGSLTAFSDGIGATMCITLNKIDRFTIE
jgi:signal transduction histidine kinase